MLLPLRNPFGPFKGLKKCGLIDRGSLNIGELQRKMRFWGSERAVSTQANLRTVRVYSKRLWTYGYCLHFITCE